MLDDTGILSKLLVKTDELCELLSELDEAAVESGGEPDDALVVTSGGFEDCAGVEVTVGTDTLTGGFTTLDDVLDDNDDETVEKKLNGTLLTGAESPAACDASTADDELTADDSPLSAAFKDVCPLFSVQPPNNIHTAAIESAAVNLLLITVSPIFNVCYYV